MGRREKRVSQQGWKTQKKLSFHQAHMDLYQVSFTAPIPSLVLPSSSPVHGESLHSPHRRKGSQFQGDAGTQSSPSGSSTPPHFLWLCTKAGTVSVPSLTLARVSGLCFNEKTRARTALRYGALMRREQR